MFDVSPAVFAPPPGACLGGDGLLTVLDKVGEAAGPLGESWELVDLPEQQSVVAQGALAGTPLGQLVAHCGPQLLGPVQLDGGSFPLLVKYIDTAQTLSVQVHPDSAAAARLGGRAKSEAWYIIDAQPDAVIYCGLQPDVTRETFAAALELGGVEKLLHTIPAQPGSLVAVPPGMVHAIGAGVLLAEVQQPSDTTYRVYDWDRLGLDGKPRQLHRSEALQSIDFDRPPPQVRRAGRVDMGVFAFELEALTVGQEPLAFGGPGPLVVVGLEGTVSLRPADGQTWAPVSCSLGDAILVPHACCHVELVPVTDAKVLAVSFP